MRADSILENSITLILSRVALSLKVYVHSLGVLLGSVLHLDVQLVVVARSDYYQLRLAC